MCYEAIRAEIVRSRTVNSNFVTSLSAGAVAGSIAGILTLPFDVLKTRTQMNVDRVATGSMAPSQLPTSTFAHMAEICAKEGAAALFQGLLPRVGKVAPACAIMISSYELVKDFFIRRRHNAENTRRSHSKSIAPQTIQPSQQPNR
jgi:solute carrier family 25 protein 39/40